MAAITGLSRNFVWRLQTSSNDTTRTSLWKKSVSRARGRPTTSISGRQPRKFYLVSRVLGAIELIKHKYCNLSISDCCNFSLFCRRGIVRR
jgi:hypothetical protein